MPTSRHTALPQSTPDWEKKIGPSSGSTKLTINARVGWPGTFYLIPNLTACVPIHGIALCCCAWDCDISAPHPLLEAAHTALRTSSVTHRRLSYSLVK